MIYPHITKKHKKSMLYVRIVYMKYILIYILIWFISVYFTLIIYSVYGTLDTFLSHHILYNVYMECIHGMVYIAWYI